MGFSKQTATTIVFILLTSLYGLTFVYLNSRTKLDIKQTNHSVRIRDNTNTPDIECSEKQTQIYYLKTHKTGSTTISNILFRLCMSSNSTFATFTKYTDKEDSKAKHALEYILGPLLGANYVNPHPADIDTSGSIKNQSDVDLRSKFDIQLEHTHFNEEDVFQIMPQGTKLVATVRHPFNHLKSVFNHYHMWREFNMKQEDEHNAVSIFLQNPYKYENNSKVFRVRNKMVFEFGIDMERLDDNDYVDTYLNYLEKRFDHVLITEYLDESLILLKRHLCWQTKDVIYLAQRNATYSGKTAKPEDYGEQFETHKKWTWVDYDLYDRFLAVHHMRVKAEGSRFQKEVAVFKQILYQVSKYCDEFQDKVWNKNAYDDEAIMRLAEEMLTIRETQFSEKLEISGADCLKMRFSHTTMRYMAVAKQYPHSCSGNESYPIKANPMYCESSIDNKLFIDTSIPMLIVRRKSGYLA